MFATSYCILVENFFLILRLPSYPIYFTSDNVLSPYYILFEFPFFKEITDSFFRYWISPARPKSANAYCIIILFLKQLNSDHWAWYFFFFKC